MRKLFTLILMCLTAFSLVACEDVPIDEEPEEEQYIINYVLNGGDLDIEDDAVLNILRGSTLEEPTVTKECSELVGWYSDSTMNVYYDFSNPVLGDLTIHAKFSEPDQACLEALNGPEEPVDPEEPEEETKELNVIFVPSRAADDILNATAYLPNVLETELSLLGYEFDQINITVASSYEYAAEAVATGVADVGFLPGQTYIDYEDGIVPILAAARDRLNKDYPNPSDWNDGLPTITLVGSKDAIYYRSLIIAGPSAKGRELADIINGGGQLSWDDIMDVNFCVGSPTSSASYIYPNYWLEDNFGKTIDDMPNAVNAGGYGASIASLEAETCDIAAVYSDARMHNPFTSGDIFALTDVIGVSEIIPNDGIFVNGDMSVKLAEALQVAFMNLISRPENSTIFDIYSHRAYSPSTFILYEGSRRVYDLEEYLD